MSHHQALRDRSMSTTSYPRTGFAAAVQQGRAAVGRLASVHQAVARRFWRLSLTRQFLMANLLIMLLSMLCVGAWISQRIESGVINRSASYTALYLDAVITPLLRPLAHQPALGPADVEKLDRVTSDLLLGKEVVAFKVWSPDGEVLYSSYGHSTGRRFPVQGGLARAVRGKVSGSLSDQDEPDRDDADADPQLSAQFLEVFAPVRQDSGDVMAVIEFYQQPDGLYAEIGAARLQAWALLATIALVTYALLVGIVKRGSDTIERQQTALQRQVTELERVLVQNGRLHSRVRQAASRTIALNDLALRRIGADLHDGPAQALALALLRLDAVQTRCAAHGCAEPSDDLDTVQAAVRDALGEVRAISAGLRIPELSPLTLTEVVEHTAHEHERRSGTQIQLESGVLPAAAPLPIKIALHRTIQEALSNATRHGHGIGVRVRTWVEANSLQLLVGDAGPGFESKDVPPNGHLGLAAMRERAELLRGEFWIESVPGRGTTVRASWPLPERGA